ncbi:MAG: MarR family transcriptional regulator [Heliobacteriaceae bacterium]|jgi:DNA-binding MarR family transcriptional regulator|nr:MarR family transcriptional regulator [Heliobacteriaceae bacterium]
MTEHIKNCFTESVYYDLQETARYTKLMWAQTFKKICPELKGVEFGALNMLMQNPGICQRDLAKIILKDRAGTGRVLDVLEAKGYITRKTDTKNNRLVRTMEITKAGTQMIENTNKKLLEVFGAFPYNIPQEEIDNIHASLKKLRDVMSKVVKIQI